MDFHLKIVFESYEKYFPIIMAMIQRHYTVSNTDTKFTHRHPLEVLLDQIGTLDFEIPGLSMGRRHRAVSKSCILHPKDFSIEEWNKFKAWNWALKTPVTAMQFKYNCSKSTIYGVIIFELYMEAQYAYSIFEEYFEKQKGDTCIRMFGSLLMTLPEKRILDKREYLAIVNKPVTSSIADIDRAIHYYLECSTQDANTLAKCRARKNSLLIDRRMIFDFNPDNPRTIQITGAPSEERKECPPLVWCMYIPEIIVNTNIEDRDLALAGGLDPDLYNISYYYTSGQSAMTIDQSQSLKSGSRVIVVRYIDHKAYSWKTYLESISSKGDRWVVIFTDAPDDMYSADKYHTIWRDAKRKKGRGHIVVNSANKSGNGAARETADGSRAGKKNGLEYSSSSASPSVSPPSTSPEQHRKSRNHGNGTVASAAAAAAASAAQSSRAYKNLVNFDDFPDDFVEEVKAVVDSLPLNSLVQIPDYKDMETDPSIITKYVSDISSKYKPTDEFNIFKDMFETNAKVRDYCPPIFISMSFPHRTERYHFLNLWNYTLQRQTK